MNNLNIQIEKDDATKFLDEVSGIMQKAKASALRKGAAVIKKQAQASLQSTGIDYNRQNTRYNDTLISGVRITKLKDGDTIGVHILGSRSSGSGTFRLRFFEKGTNERYAKTYNGKPLKKARRLGRIKSYKFFESAVVTSQTSAQNAIYEQLTKYIDNAWNKYN